MKYPTEIKDGRFILFIVSVILVSITLRVQRHSSYMGQEAEKENLSDCFSPDIQTPYLEVVLFPLVKPSGNSFTYICCWCMLINSISVIIKLTKFKYTTGIWIIFFLLIFSVDTVRKCNKKRIDLSLLLTIYQGAHWIERLS